MKTEALLHFEDTWGAKSFRNEVRKKDNPGSKSIYKPILNKLSSGHNKNIQFWIVLARKESKCRVFYVR